MKRNIEQIHIALLLISTSLILWSIQGSSKDLVIFDDRVKVEGDQAGISVNHILYGLRLSGLF